MRSFKKKKSVGTLFTPPVIVATVFLLIVFFCAVFAGQITKYDPAEINLTETMQPASSSHWLGTDATGRDTFTRLIYGARTSILNALAVVAFSIVVGVPIGMICGYHGGKIDFVVMRLWDFILSFPTLLLALLLVAALGRGEGKAVLAVGIIYIPEISKLARSLCMTEKNKSYVEAAKSMGFSNMRIIFRHILPNAIPVMMSEITLDIGYAILSLASLSFLGLGVQPPTCDWGNMLETGLKYVFRNPIMAVAPAFAIILTVVSINILSDGIQMYLDPGQRKLPSFKKLERGVKANE